MKENIIKGALYLLAASFLFSSMQSASKALYYISSFERTFYFSAVAAVLFFLVCRYRKEPLSGKRPDLLFLRSFFGFPDFVFNKGFPYCQCFTIKLNIYDFCPIGRLHLAEGKNEQGTDRRIDFSLYRCSSHSAAECDGN